MFERFAFGCTKFIDVVISTAVSSSSSSSTFILGDAGHSIIPLDGDNAVEAKECGETESLPDEYPQSDDDDNVLPDGFKEKLEVVGTEEEKCVDGNR